MRKIYLLFILLALSAFSRVDAQCITSAWLYAMPVTVNNLTAGVLTDHQVQITVNTAALVSAGKMQADGDDIRFSDGTCCVQYCYVIESGMNTASTIIWVKVPSLPASGSVDIKMFYGNPAATAGADGNCTWDMWEPFDNSVNHFTPSCGSGSYSVSGGAASMSWSSNYVYVSDLTFPVGTVYTTEANITAASGNWPGINMSREAAGSNYGYSILLGSGVRIGKAGSSAPDMCRGENWASSVYTTPGSVVGKWAITWITTGSEVAEFPGLGTITSTDSEHAKLSDLKVCFGGISGGTGSMTIDWIRVRKYASTPPTAVLGSEVVVAYATASLGADINICGSGPYVIDPIGSYATYLWSDASTDTSLTVSTDGSYWVEVTAAGASCPGRDTVNIAFVPAPVISLVDSMGFCAGDTLTVDGGSGFASYDWSTGASTQMIPVTTPGVLTLTVTDSTGCDATDTITVYNYPSPVLALDDSLFFCPGDTIMLDAGAGFTTYLWSNGDTTQTTFGGVGTYTVTVTNSDGCATSGTTVAASAALPAVSFTSATSGGGFTIDFTYTGSSGVTWAWDFGDGGTSTLEDPSHTFSTDSVYNVCLTVTDLATGCSNTHCEAIGIVGIGNSLAGGYVNVFPNPATEVLNIEYSLGSSAVVNADLFSMNGTLLKTVQSAASASGTLSIDVRELPAAVYTLRISTPTGVKVVRVNVQ